MRYLFIMFICIGCNYNNDPVCQLEETRECNCLYQKTGVQTCEMVVDVQLVFNGEKDYRAVESLQWSDCNCPCTEYMEWFCDINDKECVDKVKKNWNRMEESESIDFGSQYCDWAMDQWYSLGGVCK